MGLEAILGVSFCCSRCGQLGPLHKQGRKCFESEPYPAEAKRQTSELRLAALGQQKSAYPLWEQLILALPLHVGVAALGRSWKRPSPGESGQAL